MCLDTNWPKLEKEVWLKDKPDTITAYKVVDVKEFGGGQHACPPFFYSIGEYKKTNIIEKEVEAVAPVRGEKYLPHFHLFLDRCGASHWVRDLYGSNPAILECEIPKDQITTIGTQEGHTTIVTKEFTFVEDDKYFKEKD